MNKFFEGKFMDEAFLLSHRYFSQPNKPFYRIRKQSKNRFSELRNPYSLKKNTPSICFTDTVPDRLKSIKNSQNLNNYKFCVSKTNKNTFFKL